jgi:hypothetical protein
MAKNDNLLLYKLIVLYMLSRVDFPLTKAQICDFILEKGYTDFLTLQQAVSELIDSDMVTAKPIRNRTHTVNDRRRPQDAAVFSGPYKPCDT